MGDKAVVVAGDDMGDGLQCADHPYQISPGGICAFCLQDRLGKLVSSSNTDPFFPPTSDVAPLVASDTALKTGSTSDGGGRGRSSKFPFLSAAGIQRRNKKDGVGYGPYKRRVSAAVASSSTTTTTSSSSSNSSSGFALKRSKSANPRPLGGLAETSSSTDGRSSATDSPRKKSSFWSFFHLSSAAGSKSKSRSTSAAAAAGADLKSGEVKAIAAEEAAVESPGGSQASSSFGRRVSRSRSVGCGSRSFSGDLLERISTGFADCTLRRVESQREAKCKAVAGGDDERRIKERVKCGGLFGGFGMLSSSSSSSYWISAAAAADREFDKGRSSVAARGRRSWSWGWAAFSSPMRAFKPSPSSSSTIPLVITTGGGGPTSVVTSTAGGAPTTAIAGDGVAVSNSKIGLN